MSYPNPIITMPNVSQLWLYISKKKNQFIYHLISKNTINAIFKQRNHPVQTLDLIFSERTSSDVCKEVYI
jgi:hypothetical protein